MMNIGYGEPAGDWQQVTLSWNIGRWATIRSLLRFWKPATLSLEMNVKGVLTIDTIGVFINQERNHILNPGST